MTFGCLTGWLQYGLRLKKQSEQFVENFPEQISKMQLIQVGSLQQTLMKNSPEDNFSFSSQCSECLLLCQNCTNFCFVVWVVAVTALVVLLLIHLCFQFG